MGWGTPDHDHTDFAGRGDLEYEADERRRLSDEVNILDRRISDQGDWVHEDIQTLREVVGDLQDRVEKLETAR